MLGASPLAFTYALRVTRTVRLGVQPGMRWQWTARVALGLAAVDALWATIYVILELIFPIES